LPNRPFYRKGKKREEGRGGRKKKNRHRQIIDERLFPSFIQHRLEGRGGREKKGKEGSHPQRHVLGDSLSCLSETLSRGGKKGRGGRGDSFGMGGGDFTAGRTCFISARSSKIPLGKKEGKWEKKGGGKKGDRSW